MGGSRILGFLAQSIQDGKIYMGKHCRILPPLSSHQKSYLLAAKEMMSFYEVIRDIPYPLVLEDINQGKKLPNTLSHSLLCAQYGPFAAELKLLDRAEIAPAQAHVIGMTGDSAIGYGFGIARLKGLYDQERPSK